MDKVIYIERAKHACIDMFTKDIMTIQRDMKEMRYIVRDWGKYTLGEVDRYVQAK